MNYNPFTRTEELWNKEEEKNNIREKIRRRDAFGGPNVGKPIEVELSTVFDDTIENLLNEFNNKVDDKKKYINDEYQRINEIPLPKPPNTNLLDNMFKFIKQEKGDIQKSRSHIMELLDKAIKDIENETKDITSKKDIIEKSTNLDLIVNNVKHNVSLFELEIENENKYQELFGIIKEKENNLHELQQELEKKDFEAIANIDKERTIINEKDEIIENYKKQLDVLKTNIESERKNQKDIIKRLQTAKQLGENELGDLYDKIIIYNDSIQTLFNINKQKENEIEELQAKFQKQAAERQQEIRKSDISDKKKDQQIKDLQNQQIENTEIFEDWKILQNKTRNKLEEFKKQLRKEKHEHKKDVKKLERRLGIQERKLGIQKEEAKKESSFGPLEVVTNIFPVPFKNSLGFHIGNITTTHTGKKPYTSTDTVDHYLYNLYNQIQDERSSQKAIKDDKTHFKNHTRKMVHYPVRFRTDDQGNRIQPNNQQVKLNIPNQGNQIQSNDDDGEEQEERGGGKNNTRRTRKRVVKIKHKRNTRRPIKKINNKTRKENK